MFHPEKGGSSMQKNFGGGEAASLHLVILLFPIEVTHSSWLFLGRGELSNPDYGEINVLMQLGATVDLMPTIANITGASLPKVALDGIDLSPLLFHNMNVSLITLGIIVEIAGFYAVNERSQTYFSTPETCSYTV